MKKKIMIITCVLWLALPVFSLAKEKTELGPNASAVEHADENAKFKRTRGLYFSKKNREIRARKRAEKKEKKEAERKKKIDEEQDKGEGQFKLEF